MAAVSRRAGLPLWDRVRWGLVLALTYFPLVAFGLPYPFNDVLRMALLVLLFPRPWALLAALPALAYQSSQDDYLAFIWICTIANIIILLSTTSSLRRARHFNRLVIYLFKGASICMGASVLVQILQVINPFGFNAMFQAQWPMVSGLQDVRGCAFFTEPSLMAGPVGLYCVLAMLRHEVLGARARRRPQAIADGLLVVCILAGRSISVLTSTILEFLRRLKLRTMLMLAPVAAAVAGFAFYQRFNEVLSGMGEFRAADLTKNLGSWRDVPDQAIIANLHDFLLPNFRFGLRARITQFVTDLDSSMSWVENVYSYFSSACSSIGFILFAVLTGLLLYALLRHQRRVSRIAWTLFLVFLTLFLVPKYDQSTWLALALLWAFQERAHLHRLRVAGAA